MILILWHKHFKYRNSNSTTRHWELWKKYFASLKINFHKAVFFAIIINASCLITSSLFTIGTFRVASSMLNCSPDQSLCYGRVIKAKKYEMREIGGHRFSVFCAINLQKFAIVHHVSTIWLILSNWCLLLSVSLPLAWSSFGWKKRSDRRGRRHNVGGKVSEGLRARFNRYTSCHPSQHRQESLQDQNDKGLLLGQTLGSLKLDQGSILLRRFKQPASNQFGCGLVSQTMKKVNLNQPLKQECLPIDKEKDKSLRKNGINFITCDDKNPR